MKNLKLNRRTLAIAALATCIFLTIPFVLAGLGSLWGRTYRIPFTVTSFVNPEQNVTFSAFAASSWSEYQNQIEAQEIENTVLISFKEVWPTDLDMVITYNSTAPGLILKTACRYVTLYRSDDNQVINRSKLLYEVNTDSPFSIDPLDMVWKDPYISGSIGEALELTWTLDGETNAVPDGSYLLDISIELIN